MPGPWASPHAAASGGASPCARSAAPAAAAMHQSAASRSGPSGAAYALPHRAERPPSGKPARKRSCEAGGSQRSCAGTESSAAQAARAQLAQLTAARHVGPAQSARPAATGRVGCRFLLRAPAFRGGAAGQLAPPAAVRASPAPLLPLAHSFPPATPSPSPSNFPSPPSVIPSRADPSGSARRKCPTTPRCSQGYKPPSSPSPFPSNALNPSRADLWHAPVAWTREFLSSRKGPRTRRHL